MRRLLAVLLLTTLAPAAGAQTPPPEQPAKATISLDLQKVGTAKERAVTFSGKRFRVRGAVSPYVPGQRVRVRVWRGRQIVLEKSKKILAPDQGTTGSFVANLRTEVHGRVRIAATHVATERMSYAHARTEPLHLIGSSAVPGQTGYTVKVLQLMLRDAGYVPGRYGVMDSRTLRAVHAFRKMSGLSRTYAATRTVLRRLMNGGGRFEVRYPQLGRHVEADLTHQVLALIDDGEVKRLYPTSSGAPSTPTVLGKWRVYRKDLGSNSLGMVHSSYFIRGYAIHGFRSVPPYPASHGCLRVPIPDAYFIYRWLRMGDWVATYYRSGKHRSVKPSANAGP